MRSAHARLDMDQLLAQHRSSGFISIEGFPNFAELSTLRRGVARVIEIGVPAMPPEGAYRTDRFRLSSDIRYQAASDPVDERFVGAGPFGHIGAAKRGRIC